MKREREQRLTTVKEEMRGNKGNRLPLESTERAQLYNRWVFPQLQKTKGTEKHAKWGWAIFFSTMYEHTLFNT